MSAIRLRMVTRLGPPSVRTRWFVGSLVAHLAFTGVLFLWPTRSRAVRGPIGPRIAVDLVGSLPGARAAAPAPASTARATPPPEKAPEKKPPEPKAAALESRKVEVREKAPKKEVETEPAPEPIETAPPDGSATDPAGPSGGTGGAETPGGTAGDGGVAGDVGGGSLLGSEYAWYGARVTAALRSQWRRPPLGNVREALTVVVGFEILRDGGVRNARILEPSGVAALDRSALRAVADAAPLPALPRTLSATSVPARFEFTWRPGDS